MEEGRKGDSLRNAQPTDETHLTIVPSLQIYSLLCMTTDSNSSIGVTFFFLDSTLHVPSFANLGENLPSHSSGINNQESQFIGTEQAPQSWTVFPSGFLMSKI